MYPNWFESFFEGLALDMWRGVCTPEQTARDAAFLAAHLELREGMCALDVPCGNGRHSIELAKRGVRMTAVDISRGFLEEARAKAPEIEWVQGDMRNLPRLGRWSDRFDAAFCWGNSFAYFEHDECQRFLDAVASTLKPGGRFVLDSGAVAECLLPVIQLERDMMIGDIRFQSRNIYDASDSRMDITYTFTRGSEQEVKPIHQWVHSGGEIRRMFRRAGLEAVAEFGDLEGARFELRSPRLLAVARKVDGTMHA